jgi:flagellin
MIINHNLGAINAQRNMGINSGAAAKSMEKLSSGLRINRAGDDAAGLSISEKMRAQIRGLDQASTNAEDGISLIQTAEGALNETHSILQRMRELSVQAGNDTNNTSDRSQIQKEIDQLTEEIDRISNTTEFNTKKLLNGGAGLSVSDGTAIGNASSGVNTKQGTYTVGGTITLATSATTADGAHTGATASATVKAAGTLTINGVDITVTAADTYQDLADKINSSVSGVKVDFSGTGNTLKIQTTGVGANEKLDISASADIIAGTDYSTEANLAGTNASGATITGSTLSFEGNKVTVNGGDADGLTFDLKTTTGGSITVNGSLSFHIGANKDQTMSVSINSTDSTSIGVKNIDVTTVDGAEKAISAVNDAIENISNERSKLGAYQNRLEHTINNLDTSSENLTAAESRIRDTDMASEMSAYSKNNILQQAAQAMLAQAKSAPEQVLQLLR